MEKNRLIPLAVLGLTVAGISSGCSYKSESIDQKAIEMLSDSKKTTFIVDGTSEIAENHGMNIRLYPGNVYEAEANANTVIGRIPAGTVILNAVKFNSKWAAADCANVFNDPKSDKKGQICYFDYRDYTHETNASNN